VLEWLQLGKRPEWQEISKQGIELKHYWHNFDLLELNNNMMYQKVVTNDRSLNFATMYATFCLQTTACKNHRRAFRFQEDLPQNSKPISLV